MVYETKYYNILGVAPNASQEEMKRGFRKLAMIHHPDRNPAGAQKFAEISTVYDVLSDESLRQIYDLTGNVARWQNLIPSSPWIVPGWRAWGAQSKERKGSNFAA